MRHSRMIAAVASLACGLGALAAGSAAAAPGRQVLQPSSPAAAASSRLAATPAATPIEFFVSLKLGDPAGAAALERAVSDPASPSYRHFLTPAQWENRYSPSPAAVHAVTAFLSAQGIDVERVTPDRMTIEASGTAASVERAFATTLAQYRHNGRTLRLASRALSAPSDIAGLIAGVSGVDQIAARPAGLKREGNGKEKPVQGGREIPPTPGFRNATPCSEWYGQKSDTTDPAYGGGYPSPLPYSVCGYVPAQLQGAYGLTSSISRGIDGSGVTVAVVDAYVSPTLFGDAHEYSVRNQPGQVLSAGQFSELTSKTHAGNIEQCEAAEWFGEATLDVEAVHATAPGAHILYVGAKNCEAALFPAVQEVVDRHLAQVITNSWSDNGGDLVDSAGLRAGFDNVLLMAAGTGIGVQFSAGDEGDEFINFGIDVGDYPPTSPYTTSVGGTTLQVGKAGERLGELGWSTSKSTLCTSALLSEELPGCTAATLGEWTRPAPGAYLYGGGGATSYVYEEPWYQDGVVPAALADRNSSTTGIANRVEPDISMDGDPTTGMLVGQTQTFPDGVYYDQYRIGGTSLSSPLLAGVIADADQAAGGSLGFVNPLLYRLGSSSPAIYDVVPGGPQANVRVDYIDEVDASEGTRTSVRTFGYEGPEEYCTRKGSCTEQDVTLDTAPGFDSMTGLGSPGDGLIAAVSAP